MALFNRDYDRDYRYGSGTGNRGGMARYDRDFGDRMRAGWNNVKGEARENTGMGYDRDYRYRGTPGGRVGGGLTNNNRYDRDYRTVDRGYGGEYKSRWQTDQGDPFNDRQRQTPFRVTRGDYEGGYDRDYNRGNDRNQGSYSTGVGYDPYNNPNQQSQEGRAWNMRQNRGYDRGF